MRGLRVEHRFLMVEQLLQRAVNFVGNDVAGPEIVHRLALGFEGGEAELLFFRGAPFARAGAAVFHLGHQLGQAFLIFGQDVF